MSDEILERTKIKSLIQNYGTQKNRHCVSRILGLCCVEPSRMWRGGPTVECECNGTSSQLENWQFSYC